MGKVESDLQHVNRQEIGDRQDACPTEKERAGLVSGSWCQSQLSTGEPVEVKFHHGAFKRKNTLLFVAPVIGMTT